MWTHHIDIPAGETNYVVTEQYTLPIDLDVLPRNTNDVLILEKDYQPRVFKSAISFNSYLLEGDPGNAKAHAEIGKSHLFLNETTEAERFLRQAIELAPSADEPHYYLGILRRMAGRVADAKAEFRAAIQANPNHHKAHGNLGLILLGEGNLAEAELHLQSAVRLDPDDAIARNALAEIARARAGGGQR